jgi:hypothetical protein
MSWLATCQTRHVCDKAYESVPHVLPPIKDRTGAAGDQHIGCGLPHDLKEYNRLHQFYRARCDPCPNSIVSQFRFQGELGSEFNTASAGCLTIPSYRPGTDHMTCTCWVPRCESFSFIPRLSGGGWAEWPYSQKPFCLVSRGDFSMFATFMLLSISPIGASDLFCIP